MDEPVEESHVPTDAELTKLSMSVGQLLLSEGTTCATAESCTGGMVAKLLTDIAGSSAWFVGGFVCYSNAGKHAMLGVPEQIITDAGAVSKPVVDALARGAIVQTGADVAVAISGVAGPGGGTKEKPVGTVWIGWAATVPATGAEVVLSRYYLFSGSRDDIRRASAGQALRGILEIQARIKDQGSST